MLGYTRVVSIRTTSDEMSDAPLPEPPDVEIEFDFDLPRLSELRSVVRAYAESYGLDSDRVDGFELAASEIATNSISYGGGCGHLRCWRSASACVCELRDAGRFEPSATGRLRPAPGQANGYGLWLAQQLCDQVQIRSGARGTVVRLTTG
jgi:anti-sigma regulatory factor (Ser/Thr protein kinase)